MIDDQSVHVLCLCAVQVIDTCHAVGISKKCVRLRPIIVVKG